MTATWVKRDVPTMCATIDCGGEGTWTYGWFPYCDECHWRATQKPEVVQKEVAAQGHEKHRIEVRAGSGKRSLTEEEILLTLRGNIDRARADKARLAFLVYHIVESDPGSAEISGIYSSGGSPLLLGDALGMAVSGLHMATEEIRQAKQAHESPMMLDLLMDLHDGTVTALRAVLEAERRFMGGGA